MTTWLAVDESDFHGAEAVASGWLQRAQRLLDPLGRGPDHGWLAFHEGYRAHRAGDERGHASWRPGPTEAPVLELLVRARIARGELDRAAADLTELRALERRVGTPRSGPPPTTPQGSWARPPASTSGRDSCSRTPSTASSGAVHPTRRRWRGSGWP